MWDSFVVGLWPLSDIPPSRMGRKSVVPKGWWCSLWFTSQAGVAGEVKFENQDPKIIDRTQALDAWCNSHLYERLRWVINKLTGRVQTHCASVHPAAAHMQWDYWSLTWSDIMGRILWVAKNRCQCCYRVIKIGQVFGNPLSNHLSFLWPHVTWYALIVAGLLVGGLGQQNGPAVLWVREFKTGLLNPDPLTWNLCCPMRRSLMIPSDAKYSRCVLQFIRNTNGCVLSSMLVAIWIQNCGPREWRLNR